MGWLLLAMLFLFSLHLLGGWGTGDVGISLAWMELTHQHGLIEGYARSIQAYPEGVRLGIQPENGGGEYPPLSYLVLFLARRIGAMLHLSPFISFKLLLFCSQWLVVGMFLRLSRAPLLTAGFAAATMLDAVTLSYLDIFMVPWLLGGFWAMREGRNLLGVSLIAVAALFKWQPLAIMPFVLIQALGITGIAAGIAALRGRLLWQIAGVGLVLLGLLALIFGAWPFIGLRHALSHPYLSANAMNLPWLLVYGFRLLLDPGFGPTSAMSYATPAALHFLFLPVKLVFWVAFAAVLLRAVQAPKTVGNCLLFSVLGFVTYFTLNAGAHENHLYVPVVLAFALAALQPSPGNRLIALLLAVMLNLNMMFFYGMTGEPLRRAVQGIDLSLPFAVVFVLAWVALFAHVWRQTANSAGMAGQPQARPAPAE